jgi:aryl-alcohol dehydrogenase-like predicted oxidoreductase
MGAMRLSTAPDRDDARALATVHAALDAGVTLIDTADAYCRDAGEAGHNERLIARALASWKGDASRVRVATKGGLTRPGGRWSRTAARKACDGGDAEGCGEPPPLTRPPSLGRNGPSRLPKRRGGSP